MAEKEIKFKISLSPKNFKKNLEATKKASLSFVGRIKKAFGGIKKLIFGPISAGVIAIGAAFRKVAGVISAAADRFIELESAFADINTLIDGPGGITENTKKMIREMSVVYGTTAVDNARAYYDIVSAGIMDQTEALKLLNTANKIAVTGNENVANATKALISVMKAYGTETTSAAKAGDVLQTVVNKGITNWPELAGYISTVASSAKGAGVELEELAMMVSGLTARGFNMSQSMTSIKGILNTLVKGPGPEATKMMDEMGISFDIASVKQKGFTAVMQEMLNKMGGNSEKLGVLFREMEALTGAVSLSAKEWELLTEQFKKTDGALDKGMADKLNTISHAMEKQKRIQEKLLDKKEFAELVLFLERINTRVIGVAAGFLAWIKNAERLHKVLAVIGKMTFPSLIKDFFSGLKSVKEIEEMEKKKTIEIETKSSRKKETEDAVKVMKAQAEVSQKIKDAYANIKDLVKESADKLVEGVERIRQKTLDAIQKIRDAFFGGSSLGGVAEKTRLLKDDYKAQSAYESIRGNIKGGVSGQGQAQIARIAKGISDSDLTQLLHLIASLASLGKKVTAGELDGLLKFVQAGGDLEDIKKEYRIAAQERKAQGKAEEEAFRKEVEKNLQVAAENQVKASDKNLKASEIMQKATEQMKKAIDEHRKIVNTPIKFELRGDFTKLIEERFERKKRQGTAGPGITRVGP